MKTMKIRNVYLVWLAILSLTHYGSATENSTTVEHITTEEDITTANPLPEETSNTSIVFMETTPTANLYLNSSILELRNFNLENDEFGNSTDSKRQIPIDDKILAMNRGGLTMRSAVLRAAQHGLDVMRELYEHQEPDWYRQGAWLERDEPGHLLSKFNAPSRGAMLQARIGYASLAAAKQLQRISTIQGRTPTRASLRRTPLEGLCPDRQKARCPPASRRYRTHDGTCNAGKDGRGGAAVTPAARLLPPDYDDGIDKPRRSVLGRRSLPSPRLISRHVHGPRPGGGRVSMMLVHWGQFVDHDMTSTAQQRGFNDSVIRCCTGDGAPLHPACMPIMVPRDDPVLGRFGVTCMEFTRSSPAARHDCTLGWREQINQVTSYLDASGVYGSSARTSDSIRSFRRGQLSSGSTAGPCRASALASHCFRSGDSRISEQPGLMAVHMIMSKEHNRLADQLSDFNPHWSDEKIYQETRRIIAAMVQHITYREFLPLVLGPEVMRLFELDLLQQGYYKGYSSKADPTVANSFSAAAFRFGHSLVQDSFMRCDSEYRFIVNNVTLHEEQSGFGDRGTPHSLHRLLRGQVTQRSQRRDEFISEELTQRLFQTPNFPFGLDLAAINIARGRDHGLAAYARWREPCGLAELRDWRDLVSVMGPATVQRLRRVYDDIRDIDLFPGGLSERPVIGGLVGPTFACIIAQQFSNSRKGDKFWYENGQFESSFTPAQLQSIRLTSLSQIICNTLRSGSIQLNAMLPEGPNNPYMPCGSAPLAPIDLGPWIERATFSDTRPTFSNTFPTSQLDPNFPPSTNNKPRPTQTRPTSFNPTQHNEDLDPNFPPEDKKPQQTQSDNNFLVSTNVVDRIHDKIGGIKPPVDKISDKLNIPNNKNNRRRPKPTHKPTFRHDNETTDSRNAGSEIIADSEETDTKTDTDSSFEDDKDVTDNDTDTDTDNTTVTDTRRSTLNDRYRPDVRQNGYYDSTDANLEREYYDITIRLQKPTHGLDPLRPVTIYDTNTDSKYRPQHTSDKYRPQTQFDKYQSDRYRPITVYDTSDNVPITIHHDKRKPTVTVVDTFVNLKPDLTDRYDSHVSQKPKPTAVHDKIRPLSNAAYGSSVAHSVYDTPIITDIYDRPDPVNHDESYDRPNDNLYGNRPVNSPARPVQSDTRPSYGTRPSSYGVKPNRYTTIRPERVTYLVGYVPNRKPDRPYTDSVVTTALHDPVINDNFNTFLTYNDRPEADNRPYTTRKPIYHDTIPSYSNVRPSYTGNKPSYSNRPTYYDHTTSKPTTNYVQIASSKPNFGYGGQNYGTGTKNRPTYINNRPTYVKPNIGNIVNDPPAYAYDRPIQTTHNNDNYGHVNINSYGQKPTYSDSVPTYTENKPTSFDPRPSYSSNTNFQNSQPVLQDYYGQNIPPKPDSTKYSVVHSVTIVTNKKPEYYDNLDHQFTYSDNRKGQEHVTYVKTNPSDTDYEKISTNDQQNYNTDDKITQNKNDIYGATNSYAHKHQTYNDDTDNSHKQTYNKDQYDSNDAYGQKVTHAQTNSENYGLELTHTDKYGIIDPYEHKTPDSNDYYTQTEKKPRPVKYVYKSNVLYRIEQPEIIDTSVVNKDFEPVINYYKNNGKTEISAEGKTEEKIDEMQSRNAQIIIPKRNSVSKKKPQVNFDLLPSESEPDLWVMFEALPTKEPLPKMPILSDDESSSSPELPRPLKIARKIAND